MGLTCMSINKVSTGQMVLYKSLRWSMESSTILGIPSNVINTSDKVIGLHLSAMECQGLESIISASGCSSASSSHAKLLKTFIDKYRIDKGGEMHLWEQGMCFKLILVRELVSSLAGSTTGWSIENAVCQK
jgi:hypothetical protein